MQVNKKRALLVKVCQPENAEYLLRPGTHGAPALSRVSSCTQPVRRVLWEESKAKLPAVPAPWGREVGQGTGSMHSILPMGKITEYHSSGTSVLKDCVHPSSPGKCIHPGCHWGKRQPLGTSTGTNFNVSLGQFVPGLLHSGQGPLV